MSVKLHCSLIQNVFYFFFYMRAVIETGEGDARTCVVCSLCTRQEGLVDSVEARRMKATTTRKEDEKTNGEKRRMIEKHI